MRRSGPAVCSLLLGLLLASACGGPSRALPPAAPPEPPPPVAASAAATRGSEGEALHVPVRSVVELTVMSFNLRYGTSPDGENHWDRRAELVFDVIRTGRPDVIALQEDALFQLEQLLEAVPTYAAIGVGSTDGREEGELVAILYRTDRLQVEDRGVFWLSDRPQELGSRGWGAQHARICTWAVLRDRGTEQTFVVYNTHLDHRSSDARANGLAMIAEHIRAHAESRPVVVAGDLNLTPDDQALARFVSDTGLSDTYRAVHDEPRDDEATYHGFRGDVAGRRVDFILAGGGARAHDAEIVRTRSADGRYPSDHYPITTTLHVSRTD